MIEGKTLKFGYGDIAIQSSASVSAMRFCQLDATLTCGMDVPDDVYSIGEGILIKITPENYVIIKEALNKVWVKQQTSFVIDGYTFDFTNYNNDSIECFMKHFRNASHTLMIMYEAI